MSQKKSDFGRGKIQYGLIFAKIVAKRWLLMLLMQLTKINIFIQGTISDRVFLKSDQTIIYP